MNARFSGMAITCTWSAARYPLMRSLQSRIAMHFSNHSGICCLALGAAMARGTRNDERCRRFCDKRAAFLRPIGLVQMSFPS
jgi:hypothetical protein